MAVAAVQELEKPAVVDEEVSSETVLPTDSEASDRQPEQAQTEEFDLTKNEAFRKWQAAQDRRVAALENKYRQEQAQLRQQLEEKQLSELDDYGQLEYKYRKSEAEKEHLSRTLAEIQVQQQRTDALRAIASEASDLLDFSIPIDALAEAESPDQAWKLAASYKKQQLILQSRSSEEAKRLRQDKQDRNKVEVGKGVASTTSSKLEQKFKDAKTTTDLARIWLNGAEED